MARIDTLNNFLTDVADSIRSKTGKSETIAAKDFDTEIESIETGGGGDTEEKTVLFYDYDGSLVTSYTKEEFLNLNAMPNGPSHTGLTFTSWNWALVDAQEYVNLYDLLIIGALYRTDNGATRIHVDLKEGALTPTSRFYITGDDTTIDWGDGTIDTVEGATSSTERTMKHTYTTKGKYVIEIGANSNTNIDFLAVSNGYSLYNSSILFDNNTSTFIGNTKYQSAITNIEIGDNVTIGSYAFYNMTNLETITIPLGVIIKADAMYLFLNCMKLNTLILPDIPTITFTRKNFLNGSAFQVISFPKYINGSIVSYNSSNILSSSLNIKKISIPDNSTLSSVQLSYINNLEKITIPNNISSLASYTFSGNYALKEIVLPNAVVTLPSYIFQNCYSLEKVTLGNALTTISQGAFYGCTSLETIEIPSTVTTIAGNTGSGIFCGCSNLKQVKNFSNILAPNMFENCYSLSTIEMNISNITTIPNGCFKGCKTITSIPFEDMPRLTTINDTAFYDCASLNLIELPNTITKIGNSTFYNCYSVNISTLPENLTTLGSHAFYFCDNKNLKTIPIGVTNLYNGTFAGNRFSQMSIPSVTSITGSGTSNCPFMNMTTLVALWIGSSITNAGLGRYSLYTANVNKYKKIYIDLPRATVEGFTNYQYAFMNTAARKTVIVCNDDEGWLTQEEFDAIDWENYTEE